MQIPSPGTGMVQRPMGLAQTEEDFIRHFVVSYFFCLSSVLLAPHRYVKHPSMLQCIVRHAFLSSPNQQVEIELHLSKRDGTASTLSMNALLYNRMTHVSPKQGRLRLDLESIFPIR